MSFIKSLERKLYSKILRYKTIKTREKGKRNVKIGINGER